jgi:hypothetical protein
MLPCPCILSKNSTELPMEYVVGRVTERKEELLSYKQNKENVMELPEFTKEEIEEIVNALERSYEVAAQDFGMYGTIDRDEAWELAADADRPVTLGNLDPKLYSRLLLSDGETKEKIKLKAFPYKHYEVM